MTSAVPDTATEHVLGTALNRLDGVLATAIDRLDGEGRATGRTEPAFRGLMLTAADISALLDQPPLEPRLWAAGREPRPLPALAAMLDPWDADVLLLALAPELDLRYQRLYAYLQDDITRTRPSVALALDLLTSSAAERFAALARFHPAAPLRDSGLVQLKVEPRDLLAPALACALLPDVAVVDWLAGSGGRGSPWRFRPASEDASAAPRPGTVGTVEQSIDRLTEVLDVPGAANRTVRLSGLSGRQADWLVAEVATRLQRPLVALAVSDAVAGVASDAVVDAVRSAVLRASLSSALLLVTELDAAPLAAEEPVLRALRAFRGDLFVTGDGPVLHALTPDLALPPRRPWEQPQAPSSDAARHLARAMASWRDGPGALATKGDRVDAARVELQAVLPPSGRALPPLPEDVPLVLTESTEAALDRVAERVRGRSRVLEQWGFAEHLGVNAGVSVLFSGPSGTGKTTAARRLATRLGLVVVRVDLAQVLSKWIGETEKQLDELFSIAERPDLVLFFDEADALFGKRTAVRDAHDRYANVEVAYLLQRLEDHTGITLLATNRPDEVDQAFARRFDVTAHFPFPDENGRRQIWATSFPPRVPVRGVDLDALAVHALSGASIRRAVLSAAFTRAGNGPITMADLLRAVDVELRSLGRPPLLPMPAVAPARREPAAAAPQLSGSRRVR